MIKNQLTELSVKIKPEILEKINKIAENNKKTAYNEEMDNVIIYSTLKGLSHKNTGDILGLTRGQIQGRIDKLKLEGKI